MIAVRGEMFELLFVQCHNKSANENSALLMSVCVGGGGRGGGRRGGGWLM